MIVIPAAQYNPGDDAFNAPSSAIPTNAALVVFDGTENTYTVYEQGDELPPEPVVESA